MTCKANPQHLRLINRLKRIEEFKDDHLSITVETWCGYSTTTTVNMWSADQEKFIFKGSTMTELERFINSERKKAGLFQEKTKGGSK